MIRWIPSIGSITGTASLFMLFFTIFMALIAFAYGAGMGTFTQTFLFEKVGVLGGPTLTPMITQLMQQVPSIAFGFVGVQAWIAQSTFSSGSQVLPMFVLNNGTKIYQVMPPQFLYYLLLFGCGAIAGLIGLRKNSRIIDSVITPLISATYLVVIALIMSVVVSSILPAQVKAIPGIGTVLGLFSFQGIDYVFIFLITYLCVFLGMFSMAGLKQLIHSQMGSVATAPVAVAAKAEKVAYKVAKKVEEPEEEEKPAKKAKK